MNTDANKIPGYRLNRILTDEQKQGMRDRIAWIVDTVTPILDVLSNEDRKSYLRLSAKLELFSDEGLMFAKERPDIGPAYLVVDDFEADGEAADLLESYFRPLIGVAEQLSDNYIIARANYCSHARAYYASAQEAAKRRRPGAQQIVDRLGRAFEGQGGKGEPDGPPAPTSAPSPFGEKT